MSSEPILRPEYPVLIHANSLIRFGGEMYKSPTDGRWHAYRPIGSPTIITRMKYAWMVFTGQADALVWPDQQEEGAA